MKISDASELDSDKGAQPVEAQTPQAQPIEARPGQAPSTELSSPYLAGENFGIFRPVGQAGY